MVLDNFGFMYIYLYTKLYAMLVYRMENWIDGMKIRATKVR